MRTVHRAVVMQVILSMLAAHVTSGAFGLLVVHSV